METIRKTLIRVGLDPDMKKPVSKYSLGMRQRLGIAQAIMEEPSLLILDEPFNGLDRTGTAQMRQLIRELREQGGRSCSPVTIRRISTSCAIPSVRWTPE